MVIKYDNSIKLHKSEVRIFFLFGPPCLFVLGCLRLQINFQLKYDGLCGSLGLGVFSFYLNVAMKLVQQNKKCLYMKKKKNLDSVSILNFHRRLK